MWNALAPVNKIPPEVLSLIPGYCGRKMLVKLTHVCHSWREIFISCASLWAHSGCTDFDQTCAYLERSKTSPLDIWVTGVGYDSPVGWGTPVFSGSLDTLPFSAFFKTIPHIGQFKTLTLSGTSEEILLFTNWLVPPAPLLKNLKIHVYGEAHENHPTTLKRGLFDGNLSSLHELSLSRVAGLPWGTLTNLGTLQLNYTPTPITQLLSLFQYAPLQEIKLLDSLPEHSDVPGKQIVSLRLLKLLVISAKPLHSIILNHLQVPAGALVKLEYQDGDQNLRDLEECFNNLENISHITSVNLCFKEGMEVRLNGPTGDLYINVISMNLQPHPAESMEELQVLRNIIISATGSLTITDSETSPDLDEAEPNVQQTLLLMNKIRTLTLTDCQDLPFIFALNPNHTTSNVVVCPGLMTLFLYANDAGVYPHVDELLDMVEARASNGAKLEKILISRSCKGPMAESKVVSLQKHVSLVEFESDTFPPRWDMVPGE